MEADSIVEKILISIRSQNSINVQLQALQREHSELLNKINRNNGKLEGLLELYEEFAGESFNETVKRDTSLAVRVNEASNLGATAAQPVEPDGPKLAKKVSNKVLPRRPMPTSSKNDELEVDSPSPVLRTREPVKVAINDKDVTADEIKKEEDDSE